MRHRTIGTRQISELCLGTMTFGSSVSRETAFALLDRFVERGGTFLDTANNYCFWQEGCDGGESERLLGRWLASRGIRDEVVLATKVGALPAGPGEWPDNREGLSAQVVLAGLLGSLARLGTDRVELLYGHADDLATPLEETAEAFAALIEDGFVEQIGMSNQELARFSRARELAQKAGAPGFAALQQRHSYLPPAPTADFGVQVALDGPTLCYARTQPDVTLLAYGVLLGGAYTADPAKPLPEEYRHPVAAQALAVLREVAAEAGATANQVVYSWLLDGEPAIVPVIGVSGLSQLDEALDALDLRLTADQRQRLDAARIGRP